ncbi:hypothetical protein DEJ21_06000 [Curtobacterium sp. MCSS17_006]|nr:hypothetical protein DEJ21_06000 [Curtobacterium sp. MCSS17_006]
MIAAATGALAILGGAVTFNRTARLNREARAEERAADRDAELRAQSRESLVRVIEAGTRFLDVMRARRLRRLRKEPVDAGDRAAQLMETREILAAALLVHDQEARSGIVRGVTAFQLSTWLVDEDDWEYEKIDVRETRILSAVRELAAAHLREDATGKSRALDTIQRDWHEADEARQKYETSPS